MMTIKDQTGRHITRDASWIKRGTPATYCSNNNRISNSDQIVETQLTESENIDKSIPCIETPTLSTGPQLPVLRKSNRKTKQTKFYGRD
jgi:hypothetical protein